MKHYVFAIITVVQHQKNPFEASATVEQSNPCEASTAAGRPLCFNYIVLKNRGLW